MTPTLPDQFRIDFSSRDPQVIEKAIEKAKPIYDEYGCFVAQGLGSPEEIGAMERDIHRIIQLRMDFAGFQPQPESDGLSRFDDGFVQLNKVNRKHGSVIFDACRRLTPI